MIKHFLEKVELQEMSLSSFIQSHKEDIHPFLASTLSSVAHNIRIADEQMCKKELLSLVADIATEFEAAHREETNTLFPRILRLSEQGKKESCSFFKIRQTHYGFMLSLINRLKSSLANFQNSGSKSNLLSCAFSDLLTFEKNHRALQSFKEKYLFKKFKSCTGCKVILPSFVNSQLE